MMLPWISLPMPVCRNCEHCAALWPQQQRRSACRYSHAQPSASSSSGRLGPQATCPNRSVSLPCQLGHEVRQAATTTGSMWILNAHVWHCQRRGCKHQLPPSMNQRLASILRPALRWGSRHPAHFRRKHLRRAAGRRPLVRRLYCFCEGLNFRML